MVGGVAAVSLNRFRFPPAAELPARIGGRLAKADTAMFAQILRRLRRSIVLQIAGVAQMTWLMVIKGLPCSPGEG